MKLLSIFGAMLAMAVLSGCDSPGPSMLSVEPVATAKETAIDPALLGSWQEKSDPDLACLVRRGKDSGYLITVLSHDLLSNDPAFNLEGKLFRVGDVELLDLSPAEDNGFSIPGHSVMRVWIDGATLRWAFLDSDWLKEQAKALAIHRVEDRVHLFSPADAVRTFIAANAANEKAYGAIATWQRVQ